MRFEHADSCAKRVVEPVTAGFDPKHHPYNEEIEEEYDVRHFTIRERDRDNGGATGDGPVSRDVESLPPHHDSRNLTPIKVRHRIDVAGVIDTALHRDGRFLGGTRHRVFSCHGY